MLVTSMKSPKGNPVPNQFVITDRYVADRNLSFSRKTFQSYGTIIAEVVSFPSGDRVRLDQDYWNYSRTTSKYLALFLEMTPKEIKAKVKSGEFELDDLN